MSDYRYLLKFPIPWSKIKRTYGVWVPVACVILVAAAGAIASPYLVPLWFGSPSDHGEVATKTSERLDSSGNFEASKPVAMSNSLSVKNWNAAGIRTAPVEWIPFARPIQMTGKVGLNQDRIAHIYPMVEGSVDRVSVTLGQIVKANDLLVVIHSREIGKAKLELYQAKLQHEMAKAKDDLQAEITKNARELLVALRDGKPITEIETQFRSRGMGDYRERLLSAYSNYTKSDADVQRLEGVTGSGAISAKQLYAAQSTRNADQATFQARIEQIEYELTTSQLLTAQAVKEAYSRVAVAATSLRILGCDEKDIESIDPIQQGESISDYPIRAPFDGTVIAKDIALREQVRPDSQVLSIADLSDVWITADVYEENVPMLSSLNNKSISVRNKAWPDKTFEAKIFYTGEIMDESTRTISLRAVADNRDHLLKPGMFVNIEFPNAHEEKTLQIPTTAVQEHAGVSFVFVHRGDDEFERRDIQLGESNKTSSVITEGISEGEQVVVQGGFILKSKMLADLLGEE